MFYHLLYPLASEIGAFNVFRYITFRTGGAVLTALVISFVMGPPLIRWLKARQGKGQPIRDDGPAGHLITKQGTPTMGGCLILLALSVATLLWADLTNPFVWAVLLVTIGFGAVGFADDYLKVSRAHSHGLPGKLKLVLEIAIAALAMLWIGYAMPPPSASEPVSPMNTIAGGALNHRKPSPAPTSVPQKTTSSPTPGT